MPAAVDAASQGADPALHAELLGACSHCAAKHLVARSGGMVLWYRIDIDLRSCALALLAQHAKASRCLAILLHRYSDRHEPTAVGRLEAHRAGRHRTERDTQMSMRWVLASRVAILTFANAGSIIALVPLQHRNEVKRLVKLCELWSCYK